MQLTPDTKIGALLEAHPEVEEALIGLVPVFAKLRNPILRKTAAKVATLAHAAQVGGIPLADLLAFLHRELGQEPQGPDPAPAAPEPLEPPAWYQPARVILDLDVTALLATGEHPLGRVKRAVQGSAPGDIVALHSCFRPEPLLDTFREEGLGVWCVLREGLHRTFICKPGY